MSMFTHGNDQEEQKEKEDGRTVPGHKSKEPRSRHTRRSLRSHILDRLSELKHFQVIADN